MMRRVFRKSFADKILSVKDGRDNLILMEARPLTSDDGRLANREDYSDDGATTGPARMTSRIRFIICGAAICNALAVLYTVFPLLKDLGYQDPSYNKFLLPFQAGRTFPVNSLFIYVSCYSIFLSVVGLYCLGVAGLRRFQGSAGAFREIALLDGFLSLGALALVRTSFSMPQTLRVHGAHLLILGLLVCLTRITWLTRRLSKLSVAYDIGSAAFCTVCVAAVSCFCAYGPLEYIRGSVLVDTLSYFWPLCGAITGALLLGYLYRLAPLPTRVRSTVTIVLSIASDLYIISSLVLFCFRNDTAYFDASIIIAPMHDVLMGKDIGVNVVSTYGFLNIYLLALFCKMFGVTDFYAGLAYAVSSCFAVGYSAIYLFLRYHTRNIVLTILGMIFAVSTNFNYVHVPIHWLPQCGVFRFGAFIPILIILYFVESLRGKKSRQWLAAGVIAFSALQLPETGLYAMVAISAVVGLRVVFLRDWFFALFLGKICALLLSFAVGFELYAALKYGQLINWGDLLYFQRVYSAGRIAMANIKQVGFLGLVLLVYFLGLYVSVERLALRKSGRHDSAWIFLSVIGPLMMLYFVGKQGLSDLARVVLPAVILAVVGANYALRNFRYKPVVKVSVYGLSALAISYSWLANDRFGTKDHWLLTNPRKQSALLSWQERFFANRDTYAKFLQDVEVIKSLVPPEEGLALMSRMDTLFYTVAERKSVCRNKFYAHFFLVAEMEECANLIHTSGTKYFFQEHTNFQHYGNLVSDHTRDVIDNPINRFKLYKRLNLIDVYEVER